MSIQYKHTPDYAFHPGATLAETLEALGFTQAQLAEKIGQSFNSIDDIIKGRAAVTSEIAIQLERVTGVPSSFWKNAQQNYEQFVTAESKRIESMKVLSS